MFAIFVLDKDNYIFFKVKIFNIIHLYLKHLLNKVLKIILTIINFILCSYQFLIIKISI